MTSHEGSGDGHEERIQHELGTGIYSRAEKLRTDALQRIGVETSRLKPGVDYTVTVNPTDRTKSQVKITNSFQLSSLAPTTRLIEVTDQLGTESFTRGRFVQPDGTMWCSSDSSQGAPWIESLLPVDDLIGMMDRLDNVASTDYQVRIEFNAFRPADFRADPGPLAVASA